MKAIVVTDEAAGTAGMTLVERPAPLPGDVDFTVGVAPIADAVAAFNPTERISGQTIIRVRP